MIREDFKRYIETEKRFSAHTVKAYLSDIDLFCEYLKAGWTELASVNTQTIRGWIAEMLKSGTSARSVNRKIASLSTYYNLLMRKEIIKNNPVSGVSKPKVPKKLPVFFDEEKLCSFLDNYSDDEVGTLILDLLYATGIRVSELVNLKISDIDFDRNSLKVFGKRNKERLIPLTPSLETKLKTHIAARKSMCFAENDYLFITAKGEKVYAKMIYLLVKNKMTAAGFSGKRSPHVMRHTFATHLLNNGAELNGVKEVLGHSSLAATQVYTHNTFEKLRKIHTRTHPRA